jgi:arylsulfatase A-like enzyme
MRQEEIVKSPDDDEYLRDIHNRGYSYICDPHGVRGQMYFIPQVSQLPAELHPTQWIGDKTIEFIDEQETSSQPWMCFSSFIHPHPPFAPPNPWHKLYLAKDMPLPNVPDNYESLQTFVNRGQNRFKYRNRGIDVNLVRCMKSYYYAAISFIDYQIGRILDRLDRTGQRENTLIIFTSDHGEHLGDYNCFGKRSMHDTAARIPMLLRFPGSVDGNKICEQPVSLVDLAPTILSACDASSKSHKLDGVDLAAVAAGNCRREAVFSQWGWREKAIYMCVTNGWKYFYSAGDDKEFLFDRKNDPLETQNLATRNEFSDVQNNIREMLIHHLVTNGETAGIENGNWKQFELQVTPSDPDEGLKNQDHMWANQTIDGYSN